MSYGITAEGFNIKPTTVILQEIIDEQLATIDPSLDTSPDSILGQINGIFANQLAVLQELIQTSYNGMNPDAAEGAQLDALAALTGTIRLASTRSTVTCACDLDNATVLPAGSQINVSGQPTILFELIEEFTADADDIFDLEFQAVSYGPVAANSGTLTVITSAIPGWNSVTNATDATLGTDLETDTALRLRRKALLTLRGGSTLDAIRADVLEVSGVQSVDVFENVTMVTDSLMLPPKSFEVVVWDGAGEDAVDTEIAQAIWDSKPAGIETYGSDSANATDSRGETRSINFSRATPLDLYLDYTLVTNSLWPGDALGKAAIKAAVVAKGLTYLQLGQDVTALVFRAIPLTIAGVEDVTSMRLGFAEFPVGTTNLTVGTREIAVADTGRVTFA